MLIQFHDVFIVSYCSCFVIENVNLFKKTIWGAKSTPIILALLCLPSPPEKKTPQKKTRCKEEISTLLEHGH